MREAKDRMDGSARLLGYSGLLPQIAAIGTMLTGGPELYWTAMAVAYGYAAFIFPFLGGVWWGLGLAIAQPPRWIFVAAVMPSLIALAFTLEQKRKDYYDQLERHQKTLDVTPWLVWFAEAVLAAQQVTLKRVGFFIAKAHFYDRHRDKLNERQAKAIERMFREGPDGFNGGLSAENYISITGTSRATATRDLQDLVEIGALTRSGERRYTRYWLKLEGC